MRGRHKERKEETVPKQRKVAKKKKEAVKYPESVRAIIEKVKSGEELTFAERVELKFYLPEGDFKKLLR